MKTFRTVFPIDPAAFTLTHSDRMVLVGSCFTEHIGARLAAGKFRTLVNPRGIVYNPVSVGRSLQPAADAAADGPEVFEHQGLWHSWEHHGVFSAPERPTLLDRLRQAGGEAARFLPTANRLLVTLGTADVFVLRQTGQVVANCHKAPAAWFEQRRLTVAETEQALAGPLQHLKNAVPDLQVILTVSPVRHLRLGAVENQRSKAVLTLACAHLCDRFDFVHYFPAYELLLDDLRDYRFYAPDMLHPSDVAVEYIWQRFAEVYVPADTRNLLARLEKIRSAMAHRPFNPDTDEHRHFAREQLKKIEQFAAEYPLLDLEEEKMHFQRFLLPPGFD